MTNISGAEVITNVIDGNTLEAGKRRIIIAAIDAPELDQEYGKKSRDLLHNICYQDRKSVV